MSRPGPTPRFSQASQLCQSSDRDTIAKDDVEDVKVECEASSDQEKSGNAIQLSVLHTLQLPIEAPSGGMSAPIISHTDDAHIPPSSPPLSQTIDLSHILDDNESDESLPSAEVFFSQKEPRFNARKIVATPVSDDGEDDTYDQINKDDFQLEYASQSIALRSLVAVKLEKPEVQFTASSHSALQPIKNQNSKRSARTTAEKEPIAKRSRTSSSNDPRRMNGEAGGHHSAPSSSSQKNQQTDQVNKEVPINEFTNSTEFWYLDGSVLIIVGNVKFKLHESILDDKSRLLHDMFISGAPTSHENSGANVAKAIPIYHVDGLNPEDFTKLLKFNKNPLKQEKTFQAIIPIARAAERLEWTDALEWVTDVLEAIFPLDKLDLPPRPFAAAAVQLADRSSAATSALVPAMYDLVRQPRFRFEGDALPNTCGTSFNEYLGNTEHRPIAPFNISAKRLDQLIGARNTLQEHWRQICSFSTLVGDSASLNRTNSCECDKFQLGATGSADENHHSRRRMRDVWETQLASPPSPSASASLVADSDAPRRRRRKRVRARKVAAKESPFAPVTSVNSGSLSISQMGNLDILAGLDALCAEPWTELGLECIACITRRRKKWDAKTRQMTEVIEGLFSAGGATIEEELDSSDLYA